MVFWTGVGIVLALVLVGALVLDRRRGGGSVQAHARDDHTEAAAMVEVNRLHQQNPPWSGP